MRTLLINITKILKVYNLLKKFNLILQSAFGLGHGHNLLLYLVKKKSNIILVKKKNRNFKEQWTE